MRSNEDLRHLLVQAWSGMLALLTMMVVIDLVSLGQRGDLLPLRRDPGVAGLWFIASCGAVAVLMQMLIRSHDARFCRWCFFGITTLYALVFVGHQATHLAGGEGIGPGFVVDVTHNVIGAWAAITAYRWARAGRVSVTG